MKRLILLTGLTLIAVNACNRSANYEGKATDTIGITEGENRRRDDTEKNKLRQNKNEESRIQKQRNKQEQISRGSDPDNPLESAWESIKDPDHDNVKDDGELKNEIKNTTED